MNQLTPIIWALFYIAATSGMALLALTVVSAGLYDVRAAKARKVPALDSPRVTIIVPAHNEERVILRALDSIARQNYRNVHTIIVDDASTDHTSRVAQRWIRQNHADAGLICLHVNVGKGQALNRALRYVRTPLLMVLDADCTLHPDAVTNLVRYFDDPAVVGVGANIHIAEDPTPISYMQKIEYLVGYHHKKYNSITNSEFIIGGQGSTYRTAVVRQVGGFRSDMLTEDIHLSLSVAGLGNKQHKLVYASDAVIFTEAAPTIKALYRQRYRWKFGAMQAVFTHPKMIFSRDRRYTRLLTWLRLPQSLMGEATLLLEPFIMGLFTYIAIRQHSLSIFFGAWFTFSVYSIFVIAADNFLNKRMRLKLAALTPLMYPLFVGLSMLNIVAMAQCIKNWHRLTGKVRANATWVSPDRVGKTSLSHA